LPTPRGTTKNAQLAMYSAIITKPFLGAIFKT
jgi:hypothetical protein